MITFLGWIIMFLALASWINAVVLVNLLANNGDFPALTFIYFMVNFAVTIVLLKTSMYVIRLPRAVEVKEEE